MAYHDTLVLGPVVRGLQLDRAVVLRGTGRIISCSDIIIKTLPKNCHGYLYGLFFRSCLVFVGVALDNAQHSAVFLARSARRSWEGYNRLPTQEVQRDFY